jgi:putative transposase
VWRPRKGRLLQSFLKALGIGRERYRSWFQRYGKVNGHNRWVPRDHQVLDEERQLIIAFYQANNLEGYRRLSSMMIGADIV